MTPRPNRGAGPHPAASRPPSPSGRRKGAARNSAGPNSAAAPSTIGADGLRSRNAASSSARRDGALGLRQKVALGDDQPVGERDLAHAFSARAQGRHPVHRVDQRRHAGEREPRRQLRVGEKRVQDGRGLGEPGRLEHDAGKGRQRARFPAREDVAQGLDEIAAQGAADAAAVDQDRVARQPLVKQMVEPDLAPFVDDHQRVGEFAARAKAG